MCVSRAASKLPALVTQVAADFTSAGHALGRCDRAAAAVEFALVFPLLIFLMIGTYSVGLAMHSLSNVRYALEQTTRMLQMDSTLTEEELQEALNTQLTATGDGTVTLTVETETDEAGSSVAHLTASYPFVVAIPFMPQFESTYEMSTDVYLVVAP